MPRFHAAPLALAALAACNRAQPCPKPLEECGGMCVDVQSDRQNCGSCGAACGAGLTCAAAACVDDPNAACPTRTGGAFVTLGSCGASVKLWVERQEFIAEAKAYVAGTTGGRIPSVEVLDGTDCDGQWTWHGADLTPEWVSTQPVLPGGGNCAVCPAVIEADVQSYLLAVGRWCPLDASVLAVDERP